MADISQINVGGIDYNAKDATARTNSVTALTQLAYQEDGNTASQAYSIVGTPINWKGTLYYLKTAVAAGTTWQVGTNLTAATNLGKLTSNIKTYVNSSGKLVFRDLTGADTVLPFSGTGEVTQTVYLDAGQSKTITCQVGDICLFAGTPYGASNPETITGFTILANPYVTHFKLARITRTSITISIANLGGHTFAGVFFRGVDFGY